MASLVQAALSLAFGGGLMRFSAKRIALGLGCWIHEMKLRVSAGVLGQRLNKFGDHAMN